ncbi:MAG: ferredoxin domain-containing protein [Thermoanaerobacteraceae bacterium]
MDIIELAAQFMALSARTAPKAAGKDYIETKVVTGQDLEKLKNDMIEYGNLSNKNNFDRDAKNVSNSGAVLLISLNKSEKAGLNCGACGYNLCTNLRDLREGFEFSGPICAWRLIDLGIAIGSAVKTASILNVDNRIMYRIGVSARRLKLIDGEIVVGIPLSASGKNIYFDR